MISTMIFLFQREENQEMPNLSSMDLPWLRIFLLRELRSDFLGLQTPRNSLSPQVKFPERSLYSCLLAPAFAASLAVDPYDATFEGEMLTFASSTLQASEGFKDCTSMEDPTMDALLQVSLPHLDPMVTRSILQQQEADGFLSLGTRSEIILQNPIPTWKETTNGRFLPCWNGIFCNMISDFILISV